MSREDFYSSLEYVAAYSVLFPVGVSLSQIRHLNKTLWLLAVYLILCLSIDFLYLNALPNQEKADLIYNVWIIVESFILCLLFFLEAKSTISKWLIASGFCCFLILALLLLREDPRSSDTMVSTIEAGLIILISISYFINLLLDTSINHPISHYFFWINLAMIVYFSANILVFLKGSERLIWGFHEVIAIISNCLISIGIWQVRKASTLS